MPPSPDDVWHSRRRNGGRSATRPDTVVAALANARHGVVDRPTLLAAGLTRDEIDRRTKDRRLQVQYPGVYAVGHECLSADGHRMAAVLAGGPRTALSHRNAVYAYEMRPEKSHWIDITIRRGRGRRPPGVVAHRCKLDDEDVTVLRGIPITTPERALLDFAEVEPQIEVDRALDRAIGLRLFDDQRMGP